MGAELSQQTLLRKVLPEKQQDFDLATVGRYGVLGSTVFPTLMFYWYKLLDGRIVGTTPKIIVTKVLIDFVATMPLIIGPLHLFYKKIQLPVNSRETKKPRASAFGM